MNRPNFSNAYLVRAVRELMADWNCSPETAIDGICEGHELPRLQEEYLRGFFSVNQREVDDSDFEPPVDDRDQDEPTDYHYAGLDMEDQMRQP